MKKLINTTLLLACLAGSGFITSCSKSDSGGGTGCPAWYEGTNCETEMREKFYGTYKGTAHEPGGGSFEATLTVSAGKGSVQNIHIEWLLNGQSGNNGKPIVWEVVLNSTNSFDVPTQIIDNNPFNPNSYTDKGSGKLIGNVLTLDYVNGSHWTVAATKQTTSEDKRINLTGTWMGEGYACPDWGTLHNEQIGIVHNLETGELVATKITGDDCVKAGSVTFRGTFFGDSSVPINATFTVGTVSNPGSGTRDIQIIVKNKTLMVCNSEGITFKKQ